LISCWTGNTWYWSMPGYSPPSSSSPLKERTPVLIKVR
jgi:hypothetical protein